MSPSLPSRLLLAAIASIALYQGCTTPGTDVERTANAQDQVPAPPGTRQTTPSGSGATTTMDAVPGGEVPANEGPVEEAAEEEAKEEVVDEALVDEEPIDEALVEDATIDAVPAEEAAVEEVEPATAVCDLAAQLNQASAPEAIANPNYSVIDEQEAPQYNVPGTDVFRDGSLPSQTVDFDERALLNVLRSTRTYFSEEGCADPKILQDGVLGTQGVTVEDVIATLDFMIDILNEDIAAKRPTRLKDTDFINENFEVIRWLAYDPSYLDELRTRITKYAVFTHAGSRERTEVYDTPVYKIVDGLENEDFITEYTKQEALSGIFEPGGAEHGNVETLAYLTREGLEDALLQGTAFITFPDGTTTYFNVDRNNGIAYVPGLAQPRQERFWYFKEVTKLNGYGHSSDVKIPIEPGVTFAGDVLNIGLGKIVAIEDRNQNLRIGIIADTGGAFLPNLHQLDFFAGVFPDRATYQEAVQQLPEFTPTYFLVKKELNDSTP